MCYTNTTILTRTRGTIIDLSRTRRTSKASQTLAYVGIEPFVASSVRTRRGCTVVNQSITVGPSISSNTRTVVVCQVTVSTGRTVQAGICGFTSLAHQDLTVDPCCVTETYTTVTANTVVAGSTTQTRIGRTVVYLCLTNGPSEASDTCARVAVDSNITDSTIETRIGGTIVGDGGTSRS